MPDYEFDMMVPSSWRNFPAPPRDAAFEEELLRIAGRSSTGAPRLRVVWGGEEEIFYEGDEETPKGWYLKYHLCFTQTLKGYAYANALTGRQEVAKTLVGIPPYAGVVRPLYERREIGKPRWVIEIFREEGECSGFFKEPGYYHYLTVQGEPVNPQTGMGPYRPLGEDVLELIRGWWQFVNSTTEAEREAMREADELRQREQRAGERAKAWEDAPEAWAKIARDNHLT